MVALVEPILKAVFSITPKKIVISVATLPPTRQNWQRNATHANARRLFLPIANRGLFGWLLVAIKLLEGPYRADVLKNRKGYIQCFICVLQERHIEQLLVAR